MKDALLTRHKHFEALIKLRERTRAINIKTLAGIKVMHILYVRECSQNKGNEGYAKQV